MFHDVENIRSFLTGRITDCGILVIGDVMLDKYYFGDVSRISPEAPVPVAKVKKEKTTLGGAGNVAHNLAKLGCRVYLCGITGKDNNREQLIHMLEELEIDYSGLWPTDIPTIAKLRIVGGHQQMVRLDFEEVRPLASFVLTELEAWLRAAIGQDRVDGVVISDYGKGVCTPDFCRFIMETCHQAGIPVFVDPKGLDWEKYRGADYITPNMKELGEPLGLSVANEDAAVEQCAGQILAQFAIRNVVATRSEKGLSLIHRHHAVHFSTVAEEVFDVSGAGDTVVAVLAAGIAGGMEPGDAAQLANLAAGVVVGKMGTYPISRKELLQALQSLGKDPGYGGKLLSSFAAAAEQVEVWRSRGDKIVFTNGCFDILHAGHVTYLAKARKLGDRLLVGINSDVSVRRLKGAQRPIVPENDRARLLAALECVDGVVMFSEDTPAELVRVVKPDVLAKGGDYSPEEVVGREDAGRVEILPFEPGKSTTGIIDKILELYKGGCEG